MKTTELSVHMRKERIDRHDRVSRMRHLDNAEVYCIIDLGTHGTSGRYECHVVYTDATVDIFNEWGVLVTQKILTDQQLYWNYPINMYYDFTRDSNDMCLLDYAMRHRYEKQAY